MSYQNVFAVRRELDISDGFLEVEMVQDNGTLEVDK